MYRNFKIVPNIIFGRGAFNQLGDILKAKRPSSESCMVFVLDRVFAGSALEARLPLEKGDLLLHVNVDDEPKTSYVDELVAKVKSFSPRVPDGVIGIGGGSSMDLAKAVALMLTNPGSATDYQGWDLIKNPAVYHAAVPTLAGTGAEISRTTVLTGPEKKLGINSKRIEFRGSSPHHEFIKNYDLIDIALDGFPYNGGTTTMEAIWQGVPVIAFIGDRWAARTSASILAGTPMEKFVSDSQQGYVKTATKLATGESTADQLSQLRHSMRETLLKCRVCNAASLARSMEDVYRKIFLTACQ